MMRYLPARHYLSFGVVAFALAAFSGWVGLGWAPSFISCVLFLITGAALIMVTVFSAFSLADTITIKSIGVGMAIAVALDATIIRVLLVPATMRLLGSWNWWAPGPLGRLAERFGFSHVEDEDDLVATGGSGGSEPASPAGAPA